MIRKKIARYLSGRKFIQNILENPADISEFKKRPTPRLVTGLCLMFLSYILGWPAVFALTFLAVWLQKPLIAVIGGPAIYGFSCIVFIVGAWLARAPHYMGILAKYALQSFFKKIT